MDAALASMLTEVMTLRHYQSQDPYGVPTFGAPQQVPARLERRTRQVINRSGQEVTSRVLVFVGPAVTLSHRDQLTLPDGTSPGIQDLFEVTDLDGSRHHWEVLL